jgi:hypothetical protein
MTADGGQTWQTSPPIVLDDPQVSAIAPVTPAHGFAIVRGDTLIAIADGAHSWRHLPAAAPIWRGGV